MPVNIVVDLGFGDSGKGACTDYLTRKYNSNLVVRYNGGSQAAHRVVLDNGNSFIFSQFGSGTLAGAKTFLSRFMIVNLANLYYEGKELWERGILESFKNLYISENCLCTTPFHIAANRIVECSRGDNRHGSCGKGLGETVGDSIAFPQDALRVKDGKNYNVILEKLERIRTRKLDNFFFLGQENEYPEHIQKEFLLLENESVSRIIARDFCEIYKLIQVVSDNFLEDYLQKNDSVIFEGAQGVLLHEDKGFTPYVTWTDTSTKNADILLDEAGYTGERTKVGVLRSYMTRHGAGPFPGYTPEYNSLLPPDKCNQLNEWQGEFKRGPLDLVLVNYALKINGKIDEIHISHMDELEFIPKRAIESYCVNNEKYDPSSTLLMHHPCHTQQMFNAKPAITWSCKSKAEFIQRIEEYIGIPINVLGYGPSYTERMVAKQLVAC